MEQEIVQNTNLDNTKSSQTSFGFLFHNLIRVVILILVTQFVRLTILHFNYKIFLNERFAFSLNIPITIIYCLYFLVFGLVVGYLWRRWNHLSTTVQVGFIFILAGGLANLGERLYFGHVTDYIFLLNGVLNLADFYIFLGAALVIFSRKNSGKL